MTEPRAMLKASDLGLGAQDEEILDVLDLPQLYTRPNAATLLSTLCDLASPPPSWHPSPAQPSTPRSVQSGTATPLRKRPKVRSEGLPQYLTKIVSSSLAWIEDDGEKERVWEEAARRLSERSGRSGMGALTRTFVIPCQKWSRSAGNEEERTGRDGGGREEEEEEAEAVEITLHEPALTADNLGLKTWASSYLLAKRLSVLYRAPGLLPTLSRLHSCSNDDTTLKILELGAGTGLVGLAAALTFQTHVLLTDLPAIVPNLERNVLANASLFTTHAQARADTAVLDWSHPSALLLPNGESALPQSFEVILAADPIYSPEHPGLLVQAIEWHLSREKERARVVIAVPLREGFQGEREELKRRLEGMGLGVKEEGEEVGFDDWGDGRDGEELAEVRCWWSVWGWK